MAKKALGSNLDSIFDNDSLFEESSQQGVTTVKISEIEPNKNQPRKVFDMEQLNALADSIVEHGIIQPLTVRELDSGAYQIVAGERRWRAAKIAGLHEVPVRVMELSDVQVAQIALIENLQREDLNPMEEAMGYRSLMDNYGLKQDEVAKKVGKSRSSIANSLRLLEMPEEMQEWTKRGLLSPGHCRAILALPTKNEMISVADKVIKDGASVRTAENMVKVRKEMKARPDDRDEMIRKETFLAEAEILLTNHLMKPVKILKGRKKLTVMIDVADDDELKELIFTLTKEGNENAGY